MRETAERIKREREGEIETGTGIGCETDAIETGTETEGIYFLCSVFQHCLSTQYSFIKFSVKLYDQMYYATHTNRHPNST